MRYYADIQNAFEHGRQRGARSRAQAYAQEGDYDAAADSLMDADPARAQAYRSRADRGAAQEFAGAYQAGEFNRAGKIAAARGDVEGVATAQGGPAAQEERANTALYRGIQANLAELRTMAANNGQGYEQYYARSRQALQQNPNMPAPLRTLAENLPPTWSPDVLTMTEAAGAEVRNMLLSPRESATLEATQNRSSGRYATPEEVAANGYRPGTVLWIPDAGRPIVSQAPLAPSTSRSGDPTRLPSGYVLE